MMHPYSINLRERPVVYFVLAALSFGVSLLIGTVLAMFRWTPPNWLDIPGAFTIFGLLSWWFDRRVWRWRVVRWFGLSTPALEGEWSGATSSSFDNFAQEHPVTVTIRQTWTTMAILLAGEQSRSFSTTAAISMGTEPALVYSYINQPEVSAPRTMHIHLGTASLRITPDELIGEYYSGRDRRNFGVIKLRHAKSGGA